jgi:hypothetical protein
MASRNHIAKILRHVLSLSLPPLVGACGGIDTEGFETVACKADGSTEYLAGAKPKDAADYVELRQLEDFSGGAPRAIDSTGAKCANATDKAACEAKIAEVMSDKGFFLGGCTDVCVRHVLIVNTGDDVQVLATKEEVNAWLGPIDAPADAVLVASLAGYRVACNEPEMGGVRPAGSTYEVLGTKYTSTCSPIEEKLFILGVSAEGAVTEVDAEVINSDSNACIGRRPAGLLHGEGRGTSAVGAYFANVAQLEAASVNAFEALEEELSHHGAPAELVERARMARRDEVRHARVMQHVSARHGGRFEAPRVEKRPVRSLEEIAIENAAEGCVRETFGALVGMWQAEFARDADVRRIMKRIARDETRHAELSWAVDAWARQRLSPEALQRVEEARRCALHAIAEEAERGYDEELVEIAGMPGQEAASRLARHFAEAIGAVSA